MIKNYLIIACRNLLRNKAFSMINIVGLAVGMTACLFILQYVRFEKSYDAFHKHADNICRLTMDRYVGGEFKFKSAKTYPAIAPRLNEDFPVVVDYVRLMPDHGILADERTSDLMKIRYSWRMRHSLIFFPSSYFREHPIMYWKLPIRLYYRIAQQ